MQRRVAAVALGLVASRLGVAQVAYASEAKPAATRPGSLTAELTLGVAASPNRLGGAVSLGVQPWRLPSGSRLSVGGNLIAAALDGGAVGGGGVSLAATLWTTERWLVGAAIGADGLYRSSALANRGVGLSAVVSLFFGYLADFSTSAYGLSLTCVQPMTEPVRSERLWIGGLTVFF